MRRPTPGTPVLLAALLAGACAAPGDAPPASAPVSGALPRVLLIGDSISVGYTQAVQRLLAGDADVQRNPGNAEHTGVGLRELDAWLGDGHWDVIHFNWGLHDLCWRGADGRRRDRENGTLTHTPEEYAANLDVLVRRLKRTGARLIWATTTPVPPGEAGRFAGDAVRYNAAAAGVMERHGVAVHDLFAAVAPRLAELQPRPGDVHFSRAGSEFLACRVAAEIRAALEDGGAPPARERRANVVVVMSDDAGWADFSFQGSESVPTPHLDSIAARGVRFTQGYVTASVCSPSRAGLLTGRYQERFGHELNFPPRWSETKGLPLSETTLAQRLRGRGYATGAVGKWHLGYAEHFHPLHRGFDEFTGFLQGMRSYRPREGSAVGHLLRGHDPEPEDFSYLTDFLGEEAAGFVERHHARPFFLFLSFNAVHTPMHADPEVLAAVEGIQDEKRRKLVAMTVSMDRAVGRLLAKLEEHGLVDDTLLFFVNDNGGATNNASSNAPLRGTKGTPFEGGIRVPFLVQWPRVLPAGVTFDAPVSTLDVVPSALAAAGLPPGGTARPLDGVDLVPFLTGRVAERPHPTLFWRRGDELAIRDGDWKLLREAGGEPRLFDLAADPGETTDRSAEHPELTGRLLALFLDWAGECAEPRWARH